MIDEEKIETAMRYSKASMRRLCATWMACKDVDVRGVPGAFVECGVWRGGNVMVARWASPSRQCWLYDTFAGMTEPGEHDKKRNRKVAVGHEWVGKSAVTSAEVIRNLQAECVYDTDKISIIVGDVRQTLLHSFQLPKQIAVLRLDTDFYDSTKIEMEVLYPRLSVGGYLIVDDYGHWMGAKKAVDEYLVGGNRLRLIAGDYTGAWMIK